MVREGVAVWFDHEHDFRQFAWDLMSMQFIVRCAKTENGEQCPAYKSWVQSNEPVVPNA